MNASLPSAFCFKVINYLLNLFNRYGLSHIISPCVSFSRLCPLGMGPFSLRNFCHIRIVYILFISLMLMRSIVMSL